VDPDEVDIPASQRSDCRIEDLFLDLGGDVVLVFESGESRSKSTEPSLGFDQPRIPFGSGASYSATSAWQRARSAAFFGSSLIGRINGASSIHATKGFISDTRRAASSAKPLRACVSSCKSPSGL